MMRGVVALVCLLSLAGCNARFGGPPLISGQSPAAAQSHNSEPQPPGSLPPGFAGVGGGPNATAPDYASITFSARH